MNRTGSWRAMTIAGSLSLLGGMACSGGPTDPDATDERTFPDHREVDLTFMSDGARLAGTLYLPLGSGPYPTVVLNEGSSWTTRATWEQASLFATLGVAVFAFDKRGQGESGGECCSADDEVTFPLLASDAVAAVRAVRGVEGVDAGLVGVSGASYSGWTVPLAANMARSDIAFVMVFLGGVVSVGQEHLYDELTGYGSCVPSGRTDAEVTDLLVAAGSSGFDPIPSLEALEQPTLWLYGGKDLSHPTTLSVRLLDEIQSRDPKPWTVTVLPNANHEFVEDGTICQADGPLADVQSPVSGFLSSLR